jgi:adenylate kinase
MWGTSGVGKTALASAFTMRCKGWTSVNLNTQLRVTSKLSPSELEALSPAYGLPLISEMMADLLVASRFSPVLVDGHFQIPSEDGHKPVLDSWAAEVAGYIVIQAPADQIFARLNRRSDEGNRVISTATVTSVDRSQQLELAEAEAAAAIFGKPFINVENGNGQMADALRNIQEFTKYLTRQVDIEDSP